ncbi:hypothetical protein EDD17DRAFT_1756453 [Pisolithus thermaeus]|nr:hypothetical protein EDD17DRAFT_1756453 [Pisolithus thermaeus]
MSQVAHVSIEKSAASTLLCKPEDYESYLQILEKYDEWIIYGWDIGHNSDYLRLLSQVYGSIEITIHHAANILKAGDVVVDEDLNPKILQLNPQISSFATLSTPNASSVEEPMAIEQPSASSAKRQNFKEKIDNFLALRESIMVSANLISIQSPDTAFSSRGHDTPPHLVNTMFFGSEDTTKFQVEVHPLSYLVDQEIEDNADKEDKRALTRAYAQVEELKNAIKRKKPAHFDANPPPSNNPVPTTTSNTQPARNEAQAKSDAAKPSTSRPLSNPNHFLIDALECKTSAMSFYQKLKRFTNNAFPEKVQGADEGFSAMEGSETQEVPGLNLPADWKVWYDRDTVMRQYVIDGNFTAQHMKMNKPELDVALSDGKGYMVSEGPYQNHLQHSLDSKERSTCSNHRAINAANINKSNLRSTGIGATACARHGCFVPHSVVDFQKGERYMNTDYSICNALGCGSERITKALVIYDVGCQWSVNFWSRVKNSPSLLLPPALEIVPAVGKFHLAAHKLSCFPRYSLNFFKGAGHLDGEILETLWAPFNKISPTARSMTQAHRQEVYDDHMRDSNWKKLVGLGEGFSPRRTSNKCLEEMNQAYEQLTAVLDPDKVSGWELDALRAEANRGEALDIYLLKGDKAPTFHEVQLQLMKNPMTPFRSGGSVAWLAEGISIEDSQDQLRSELQQLPNPMSTSQEVKISMKRQRLSARIEKFHSNGQAFFKGLEINGAFTPQDDPEFCGKEEEGEEDREFWGEDDGYWEVPVEEVEELASELMSIWMPSSIGSDKLTELGLVDLLKEEGELRIGQANDCLDQLRMDLGNKAMLY